jgi:hypothetical protein
MKFRVKRYDEAGNEIIEESLEHSGVVERDLNKRFDSDANVAKFEITRLADGRKTFTLKDRSDKIIIQYKEI